MTLAEVYPTAENNPQRGTPSEPGSASPEGVSALGLKGEVGSTPSVHQPPRPGCP